MSFEVLATNKAIHKLKETVDDSFNTVNESIDDMNESITNINGSIADINESIDNKILVFENVSLPNSEPIDPTYSKPDNPLATITDPRITSDHIIIGFLAEDPTFVTSKYLTMTTSDGSAVLSGYTRSDGTTTATIVLAQRDHVVPEEVGSET